MKSQDIVIHDLSIIMQEKPSEDLQNRILKSAATKDVTKHTIRHSYGIKTALIAVIITLLATVIGTLYDKRL